MSANAAPRAAEKIARLCAEPRALPALWQDVSEVLGNVVPYYWTPCWYTLDPASLLMTSHFHYGMAEFPADWLAPSTTTTTCCRCLT